MHRVRAVHSYAPRSRQAQHEYEPSSASFAVATWTVVVAKSLLLPFLLRPLAHLCLNTVDHGAPAAANAAAVADTVLRYRTRIAAMSTVLGCRSRVDQSPPPLDVSSMVAVAVRAMKMKSGWPSSRTLFSTPSVRRACLAFGLWGKMTAFGMNPLTI